MPDFSLLQLCREPVQFSGDVVLGIHSNVAGNGNELAAGHAWLSVETGSKIYFYGLWPDGHPRVLDNRENCSDIRIGLEIGAQALVSRYYKLSPSQLVRLNQYLNQPAAWGYLNNCTDWAVHGVKYVLGVNLHASDLIFLKTPRALGEVLQRLEKKAPTSPDYPRQGEIQESSFGGRQ